jgi:hypothetical protein
MTRELSHKAAAALLRNTFAAKGAALSHTEALDLLAKLKGFEAWSHLQQAGGLAPQVAQQPTAKPATPGRITVQEALMLHYGAKGECPSYARATWQAQEPGTPYWDWVVDCMRANGTWMGPEDFVTPPPVEVTLSSGRLANWNIEQNLTDRWGEVNEAHWHAKPGLPALKADDALRERLQTQMWSEDTFVVRKDGEFGLLFESEYLCDESENHNEDDPDDYPARADVVAHLVTALAKLEKQYPQVQFCIPDPTHIWYERPAIWGFYKLDALSAEQREALSMALYNALD